MSLQDIQFAELNAQEVEQKIIKNYENITGRTLYPGDPVRLFLESLAYVLILQNNLIDLAGKQNLLSYAVAGHLDHIGLIVGTKRLDATKAKALQLFTLVEELSFDVSILKGTKVTTADGKAIFETDELLIIQKGQKEGIVSITALESGTQNNGLLVGQINQIMSPIAYVKSSENITLSMLGSDIESDDRFRERIQLAPESFSNAGSYGAYRFHALKAHQDIFDVSVFCPKPGHVEIRPIGKNGTILSDDILEEIIKNVSADDVRPLTDTVTVLHPDIVEYSIQVHWWLLKSQSALLSNISKRVEAAFQEYITWQKSVIGRDINPTKLISLLENAGAYRVEVISPVYAEISNFQVAKEISSIIEYQGLED